MSRFSRAEAEAAGWVFVHSRGEFEVVTSATQGETRRTPATHSAEKYVSRPGVASQIVHEEAESEGKLLERIHAYEQHLARLADYEQPTSDVLVVNESDEVDSDGNPLRTVLGPGGVQLSEAEWAARDRQDEVHQLNEDGDLERVRFGASEQVQEVVEAKEEVKREIEERRTEEPFVPSRRQFELDPDTLGPDAPGSTGTGVIVGRGEADSPLEALQLKEQASREKEEARVDGSAEHDPALSKVDASIQSKSDLGSDKPAETPVEEAVVSGGPTELAMIEERKAFEDAVSGKVEEQVAEDGLASAQTEEATGEQIEAGIEAQGEVQVERGQEPAPHVEVPEGTSSEEAIETQPPEEPQKEQPLAVDSIFAGASEPESNEPQADLNADEAEQIESQEGEDADASKQ